MPSVSRFTSALITLAALAVSPALAQQTAPTTASGEGDIVLKLVPEDAMPRLGGYMPLRVTLSADKPATLKKAPADLSADARYGTITLGPKDKPTTVLVIVDAPEGKPSRLFVDSNANGDLTDDPGPDWKPSPRKGQDGKEYTMYQGGAKLPLDFGGHTVPVAIGLYKFDSTDPTRAALKDVLLYYRNWAFEGTATLGGKTYPVMLDDSAASGNFATGSRLGFLVDVNANGKFDSRGERFDAAKPFNIGGVTYEIKGIDAAKGTVHLAKSDTTVAEVLPTPALGTGKPAITFAVKTTDGNAVDFPASYKGKVVLLDFWATWCGPCIAEMPNVIKAYETYHEKGFEILGISLDRENAAEKLASFTKEKKMPWPQVYDGKWWKAEIAEKYGIDAIPASFLVDGDTGAIIASGDSLRGGGLEKALAEALAKKPAKPTTAEKTAAKSK